MMVLVGESGDVPGPFQNAYSTFRKGGIIPLVIGLTARSMRICFLAADQALAALANEPNALHHKINHPNACL